MPSERPGNRSGGAVHMRRMTETTVPKTAAFARALRYGYEAPTGKEIIPPYRRGLIFNRDLTAEELRSLTDSFPVPGRILRVVGGYSLMASWFLYGGLWLAILLAAAVADVFNVEVTDEHSVSALIADVLIGGSAIAGLIALPAIVVAAAGILVDFISWKRWGVELAATWERYAGRVVPTKSLPGSRRSQVDSLGGRLDAALKKLAPADPVARQLDSAARQAIGDYIDLPIPSKEARRVARSTSTHETVQQIRSQYEASQAAEVVALQAAEGAVLAVRDYAGAVKAAAAEQEIVELAKTVAAADASS